MKIYYINSNFGELFYLRYLLLHIFNFIFFDDLRFIDDNILFIYYNVYIIRDLFHNNVE